MNFMDFISGFYTALSLSSGMFFLTSRKLRAPFREAFGWLSVYSAIENLLLFIITNSRIFDEVTRESVGLCLDITCIPVITLLIATIVDQDMKTTPFKKRWLRVALLEIPIIVCMCICAFTSVEWKELLITVVLLLNVVGVFSYALYQLVRYEKQLPDDDKGKRASVKWMWTLFALLAIEIVLYLSVGTYISANIYFVVLIIFTCVATYFIDKQSPIDTRKMYAIRNENENGNENGSESGTAQQGLSRNDMRDRASQFMAKHPHFVDRMAERAKQKITVRDMFLCIMIVEGRTVNEIAEILAISPTSVDVARYRLRSKLDLNRGENLAKVLKSFM